MIVIAKLMELLTPCHNTLSGVLKKKLSLSQKYQDSASIIIFTDSSFGVEHFGIENRRLLPLTAGLYLWNSRPTIVALVLGHHSRLASPQRPLYCKYWSHKNKTFWVIRWWQISQEIEVRGTPWGLEKYRGGVPLSKPSVHPKSYPFRADKQALQQSSRKSLWYRKNSRADSQKIILADITKRCWGLCQGL